MNFYSLDLLESPAALASATVIGGAFGFWLERAGFGSSRKLSGIFYLRDFAVFQVMFTAIVTALVGLTVLSAAGYVDLSAINHMETLLVPQVVGGLLFGVGFVAGGWCPGTALVGAASGKGDALTFLAGVVIGTLGFGAAWPAIADFATGGSSGAVTLSDSLGLPTALVTTLVVAVALLGFAAIRRFAPKTALAPAPEQEAL